MGKHDRQLLWVVFPGIHCRPCGVVPGTSTRSPGSFHNFLPITCLLHAIHQPALLWTHLLLHPHGRWITGKSHQFCSKILSSWTHAVVSVWTDLTLSFWERRRRRRKEDPCSAGHVSGEVQGVSLAGLLPFYRWVTEGHRSQAAQPLPGVTTLRSVLVVASCLLYKKSSGKVSLVSDWLGPVLVSMANDHKLRDLNSSGGQRLKTGLSGLKSRCGQGRVPSGGSRGELLAFPASRGPTLLGSWPLLQPPSPSQAAISLVLLGLPLPRLRTL